jgi:hypothetical protein
MNETIISASHGVAKRRLFVTRSSGRSGRSRCRAQNRRGLKAFAVAFSLGMGWLQDKTWKHGENRQKWRVDYSRPIKTYRNMGESKSLDMSWPNLREFIWLVVYLPLWKIWVRQLGLFFPIYGKIKHVPNHQPVKRIYMKLYTYKNIRKRGEFKWI